MTTLFAAINAEVSALWLEDHPVTPLTFEVYIGEDFLAQHQDPPRIVWVPREEDLIGGQGLGGNGFTTPGPLWAREVSVEVNIWGSDLEMTEDLYEYVIQACHRLFVGCYKPLRGEWIKSGDTLMGVQYALNIQFLIPVTRRPDVTRVVTEMPITTEVEFPDGSIESGV
jgi:hypothetical protein